MVKTPTEEWKLSDAWGGFREKYGKFVTWTINAQDDFEFCQVNFAEENPEKYTNKWGREQWKIKCIQEEEEAILSGGQRLFSALRKLMEKERKNLNQLGKVQIDRYGKGFDCNYKATQLK